MSRFFKGLTGVIYWLGFLISIIFAYFFITMEGTSTNPLWLNLVIIIAPFTLGWIIKFIFTGNGKFLPF